MGSCQNITTNLVEKFCLPWTVYLGVSNFNFSEDSHHIPLTNEFRKRLLSMFVRGHLNRPAMLITTVESVDANCDKFLLDHETWFFTSQYVWIIMLKILNNFMHKCLIFEMLSILIQCSLCNSGEGICFSAHYAYLIIVLLRLKFNWE